MRPSGFVMRLLVPALLCLTASCESSTPSEDPIALAHVAAGFNRTCALTDQGSSYCWGASLDPICPTADCERPLPDTVEAGFRFTDLGLASNIFGNAVCGINTAAATYCWGFLLVGFDGGFQIGQTPQLIGAVPPLVHIEVASRHSCGLTEGGQAHCWGDYRTGVRGTGLPLADEFAAADLVPNPVAGGFTFTQLALGLGNSCGLDSGGIAYCWGSWVGLGNTDAALSTEAECGFTLPPFNGGCSHAPVEVSGGHHFRKIAAGESHLCGVTEPGEVYCWGTNGLGEIGRGDTVYAATPVRASMPEQAVTISAGIRFTCALSVSGRAYCWGQSDVGQTGLGVTSSSVLVPTAVAGRTPYRAIIAGSNHACAIRVSGELDCWGANQAGQLGTGDFVSSPVPRRVIF